MNNKVCLIGSARFEKEFIEANRELTLLGMVVYSLGVLPRDGGGKDWYTDKQKQILDLVHLKKIQESDAVFLVGDGYFGDSTAREIFWAVMNNKPVIEQNRTHSWGYAEHCLRQGIQVGHGAVLEVKAIFGSKSANAALNPGAI